MPSIDERVVSIAFNNAEFERRVAVTLGTIGKLNDKIAKTGTGPNGLENLEKSASKVKLEGVNTAVEKSVGKFHFLKNTASQALGNIASGLFMKKPAGKDAVDNLQGKLDKGFQANKAFAEVEAASNRVKFDGISRALDHVGGKFSVISGAAAVAFGNIASQAASKGAAWAKSFGIGPIMDGLHEYETNLKAIQTVQANTDQPLTKINKSLAELNEYSDQTIYNFGEMAKNVGTFTAAGVSLKDSVSSIKGISNFAALSGSSSQQAATAMYQLSQAISSGKVGLQDWNSVVNAGMGGKKLQTALATTASAMGTLEKGAVGTEGPMKKLTVNGKSFRESIQAKPGSKAWLTSDVLVTTLAAADGRFSKVALSAEKTKNGLQKYTAAQVEARIADNRAALEKKTGAKYTDEQFAALSKLSDASFKSATEVKTLGQVFDVAKETIGSGWSASFQNIFGNLKEAKKLFTGMSGFINGFINKTALARNTMLASWKDLGGRANVIQGLKNVFNVLFDVLGKVYKAFREVFPKKTAEDLAGMSKSFLIFTSKLNNSPQTIDNLARTFKGFFAVIHIGWSIVKGLAGVLFDLLGVVGKGSGGFLNFTGGMGDFLVTVDQALTKGGMLKAFFKTLTNILRVPIEMIKSGAKAFGSLFGGGDSSSMSQKIEDISKFGKVLTPIERLTTQVKDAWAKFTAVLAKAKDIISPWIDRVVESFTGLGTLAADAIRNMDFSKVLLAFQTTFMGGIFLTIKKAFGKKSGLGGNLGGILDQVKGVLGAATGQLQAMQKNVQASMILKIAGAVVLLAGGLWVMSTIPAGKLAKALTAAAVGLGELGAVLSLMSGSLTGAGGMVAIAGAMVILSVAVVILAGAMKIMATMSWEEIGKGLAGMAGALAAVGGALKLINPASIIPIGFGLLLVAGAMVVMATAMTIFAELKWEELLKGLIGVAGAMAILAAGLLPMGPSLIIVGPGLVAAAFGMTLLAGAVAAMGAVDPKKMLSGILGLGLALGVLGAFLVAFGIAISVLGPTMALAGPTIILAAIGLRILAGAVGAFGELPIAVLVKGLIAMAAALVILAVGLYLMIGTAPGALALMGAAAAFAVLGPALAFMGVLPWKVILTGLAAMALTLGILAVVGMLAAPAIAALGISLIQLGAGLALIGLAVLLAGKGFTLLGANGTKGIAVLIAAISGLIAILPSMVIDFVKGLLVIAESLAKIAPKVLEALGKMIDMVIAFVIQAAPKLAVAIGTLIASILLVISQNSGPLIKAGWSLIQKLLDGISSNVGSVVTKVGDIIVKFLNAMTVQYPRIIQAGAKMLGSFLGGIATALPTILVQAAKVVRKFLEGITAQLPGVIRKGTTLIVTFINGVAQNVGRIISAGTNLIVKFMEGIGTAVPRLVKKGLWVARRFLNGLADGMSGLADAGFRAIIRFLRGIEQAIRDNSEDLFNAGAGIFDAIMDGIVIQAGKVGPILEKVMNKAVGWLPKWAKKILGIKSPSTVFAEIGKNTMLGLVNGIEGSSNVVTKTMGSSASNIVDAAQKGLSKVPDIGLNTEPVIAPVLDLSNVKQEAKKLSGLTNVAPITANVSYDQATAISSEKQSSDAINVSEAAKAQESKSLIFEQNNYSPESLSDSEIYRQTKNQLSQAKAMLNAA